MSHGWGPPKTASSPAWHCQRMRGRRSDLDVMATRITMSCSPVAPVTARTADGCRIIVETDDRVTDIVGEDYPRIEVFATWHRLAMGVWLWRVQYIDQASRAIGKFGEGFEG